ncbi:hypothetical protein DOTSEDRAFT_19028 [Dothistroma septosporum NZE10]|uniref:Uncharacterized protein n=1 Tax=Dothistroma septosporum (strain NZE10 / CBS 128990) TaxID=675120 RepID=N1PYJ6_DOTSN|nr:hypothetical protein DOTSEDRAFT_19028 [Dothistroma septosporum NZE10]
MTLCYYLAAAKNLLPPPKVTASDPPAASNSTTSSVDLRGPTVNPVPPPALDTEGIHHNAPDGSLFSLQDMISFFTGTSDIVNSNLTLFIVMIVFAGKDRYKEAQNEWKWINDVGEHHVYLVTRTRECEKGTDDPKDIQLWDIKEARFNEIGRTITLNGEPIGFADVFKYWSLKASNTGIFRKGGRGQEHHALPNNTALTNRGLDTSGQIILDFTVDPGSGFSWGNAPLSFLPAGSASEPVGSVICQTCSVHGTFDWDLDIGTSSSGLVTGHVSLTARNVGATLQPKLSLYSSGSEVFEYETEIWGTGIPSAGIHASKWFDVGATIALVLRVKIEKTPEPMAITAGFNISLAEEAVFRIDLENPERTQIEGWKVQVHPLEPEVSSNASMRITVGPRLLLSYGFEVLTQGASVGLIFGGGNVDVSVNTQESHHSCSKERKAKNSLEIEGGLINELAAFGQAKVAKGTATTKTLASTSTQLFSMSKTVNADLLGAPTIAVQKVDHFTPNFLEKAKSELASLTNQAKDEVETAAVTVTSAVESVASKASKGVTSAAGEAKETITAIAAQVESKATGVVAAFTGAFKNIF